MSALPPPYYQDAAVTLYHGDCRELLPCLPDGAVDLVWTDPPYGHRNNDGDLISRREAALGCATGDHPVRPIANDGPEANELVRTLFAESYRVISQGCCCCCCGGGGPDPQFARWALWLDEAFRGGFKQMIVWDKGPMGMGWHYRRSYETILVAQRGAGRWYGGRAIENIIRPGAYGVRKIIPRKHEHPTPKPVALAASFMQWHTLPGDIILDPCAGAGTAGVAAIETGRRAILMEIDERWCDMAAKRLAAAQGASVQGPGSLHQVPEQQVEPAKELPGEAEQQGDGEGQTAHAGGAAGAALGRVSHGDNVA